MATKKQCYKHPLEDPNEQERHFLLSQVQPLNALANLPKNGSFPSY
jgi:hypothetical protein